MSAWTVIAHAEVGSVSSVIEFSSIPNTYTDLFIQFTGREETPFLALRFNGSASGRTTKVLNGGGTSVGTFARSDTYVGSNLASINNGFSANSFSNVGIYIPNYASTTSPKSFSIEGTADNNSTTTNLLNIVSGFWNNNSAITSVTLAAWNSGDAQNPLVQYSSATLYGITKGSSGGVTVS